VARTIDSSGDIETVCTVSPLKTGESAILIFRSDDEPEPPYNLRVKSPAGKTIVERVLRELPTGQPQSAPPITFTVSSPGEYKVEIKQLYGKQKGDAILRVVD
jgi:hypothetical protein